METDTGTYGLIPVQISFVSLFIRLYQERTKEVIAQVRAPPADKTRPQHRHRVTPLINAWLTRSVKKADTPYVVDASESYTQYDRSSYLSGTTFPFNKKDCRNKLVIEESNSPNLIYLNVA